MITNILWAVLRAAIGFILILTVARLMGRKAISQMTFFDFCVAITLGSVTANIGFGGDSSMHAAITVLVTLCLLAILTGYLTTKSMTFSKFIDSEPVILIDNNKIVSSNMEKLRLSLTDLTALLREKNIFDITTVGYAVIEKDGKLSVLLKSDKEPLTPSDLGLHPPDKVPRRDIIMDGKILHENLEKAQLTEAWLFGVLKEKGIRHASEVFYASLDPSGDLYVSLKIAGQEKEGMHGFE